MAYSRQDHQKYLQRLHEGMQTPEEVIRSQVEKAVGSPMKTHTRIVAGQMSEVYDVMTISGEELIVRIAHQKETRYPIERWALDTIRKLGVPTPRNLQLETVQVGEKDYTFCIQTKMPGTPLKELKDELQNDRRRARTIAAHAGALLAVIHNVPTEGVGRLCAPYTGKYSDTDSYVRRRLEKGLPHLSQHTGELGCNQRDITRIGDVLEANSHLLQPPFRLLHGDFSPLHILVRGDRVTGVIDMEHASSGDPLEDLAGWNNWGMQNLPFTMEDILEGYDRMGASTETEAKLHYFRILKALPAAIFFLSQNNAGAAAVQLEKIQSDLKYFVD